MSVRSTWQRIKLSQIAEIERNSIQPSDIREGTRFVGLEHIASSGALLPSPRVSNGDLSSTKFSFSRRHVLYGKLRPYLSKIARPAFEGVCSTDILPILPGDDVDRDYLYYFLRQPELVKLATERSIGANLPRLSPTTLAEFEILLPPLPIQKQIAAILEKADAAREKRRRANQLTEQFLQSAFLEMFGDPVTNPRGWDRHSLDQLATEIHPGSTPKEETDAFADTGVLFLRSENVLNGKVALTDQQRYIRAELYEMFPRLQVMPRDVLLNMIGASIGRCAVYDGAFGKALLNQNICLIRCSTKKVHPEYLARLFLTERFQDFFKGTGRGGAQYALNARIVSELQITCPPITEQLKFAALIDNIELLRAKQRESEKELDNLFNSLMQRAFKGELEG